MTHTPSTAFVVPLSRFLLTTTLAAACALLCACSKKTGTTQPGGPNVVLIVVDTLRRDHLGSYGGAQPISKGLDAFAADAVRFENAYSTAPWTIPSVGSMLTGEYPSVLGIGRRAAAIRRAHGTLPEILGADGYATGAAVSHLFLSERFGFDRGFAYFRNVLNRRRIHSFVSSNGVTHAANAFVDRIGGAKFFLFVHYFDPHFNYIMHDLWNPFPGYDGPLKRRTIRVPDLNRGAAGLTADDLRYLRSCYESEIAFTDHAIDRLLRHLQERGLYDDALIVVTADHGEEICHHEDCWIGHGKKLTEDLVHVPLLIKYPKREQGLPRVVDGLYSLVDLMPTIAAYAGARVPDGGAIAGRAFDIRHPERGRRAVFAETQRTTDLAMIREEGWKLVLDRASGEARLYGLPPGRPGEWDRRIAENPTREKAMRHDLEEWMRQGDAAARRFGGSAPAPGLTREVAEQLEAMGYVDGELGDGAEP